MLQNTVGGGKPKMFFHFTNTTNAFPKVGDQPPPATLEEQQALVDKLQAFKTTTYKSMLETTAKPRPGVLELMDEALQDDRIAVGVCSASTKEAALKTLDITLGADRMSRLDVCILGDDVSAKKPNPLIYNEARARLGIDDPRLCVVIEDSLVGLKAAKAANMKCIITYTPSTANMDFYGFGADAKVPDLGTRGQVKLDMIFGPLREQGLDAEIMAQVTDPVGVAN
jgi:HAD superfamily hydrolase (TIGR01509 family)